ncbi:MAG: hypothetical protein J6P48_00140 [Oscillospiraceae bacterium]|nr:hypothetical protein [Oscillospiraceae bacterium]
MKRFLDFLPHLAACMAVALVVITILNGFNPLMAWLTSRTSRIFLFLFSTVVLASSITAIVRNSRR